MYIAYINKTIKIGLKKMTGVDESPNSTLVNTTTGRRTKTKWSFQLSTQALFEITVLVYNQIKASIDGSRYNERTCFERIFM